MATQSRARMFHATAKALHSAAEQRLDGDSIVLAADVSDIDFNMDLMDVDAMIEEAAPAIVRSARSVSSDDLQHLHAEFRWAESRLMQSSEKLAEAQEARRKDLVALACMRRELRASFDAERAYTRGQLELFTEALPGLERREQELAVLVEGGALTANVIQDLARIRAERKMFALAIGQSHAQLARIDEADFTLEHDVANEAYNREPDGATMRELARLRSEASRAKRESVAQAKAAIGLREELNVDTSFGEITAIASFLAAEFEGDARGKQRMERVRSAQISHELSLLPQPSSPWKAGLRHPVTFMRSRRITGAGDDI